MPLFSKSKTCILSLVSNLHPRDTASKNLERLVYLLGRPKDSITMGVYISSREVLSDANSRRCTGYIVLVGSGGTEAEIIELVEKSGKPTVLVGFNEWNSLPALLEAYSLLSLEGGQRIYPVYIDLARGEERGKLVNAYKALVGVSSLYSSRLAVIGKPSDWLVYSTYGPERGLGFNVSNLPLERFLEIYSSIQDTAPQELVPFADEKIRGISLNKAYRVYLALRNLVERYALDGFTIECFRLTEAIGVTPCYALAVLNSEGITAGCEGDVPSMLTMHLLSIISGRPAMMGNITKVAGREVIISHCTAPIAMGDSYKLTTHFETGLGVGVEVRVPRGRRMTLAKLDPRRRVLVAGEAKVLASGTLSPKMCRTQLHLQLGFEAEELLKWPVGGHMALVSGLWGGVLEAAAGLLGVKPVVLG